ncbi:MAG: proteasome subunit beta, partial [Natronomonas sp.]
VAYGTLEQEYRDDMTNEEAKTVAAAGVKAAVERDTGSGNGVFLATVTEEGVDIKGHKDFDEVL